MLKIFSLLFLLPFHLPQVWYPFCNPRWLDPAGRGERDGSPERGGQFSPPLSPRRRRRERKDCLFRRHGSHDGRLLWETRHGLEFDHSSHCLGYGLPWHGQRLTQVTIRFVHVCLYPQDVPGKLCDVSVKFNETVPPPCLVFAFYCHSNMCVYIMCSNVKCKDKVLMD